MDISLNIPIANNNISIRSEEGDKRAKKFIILYKIGKRKQSTSTARCYSEHIKTSFYVKEFKIVFKEGKENVRAV